MAKKIVFVNIDGWEKEYLISKLNKNENILSFVDNVNSIDKDCEILSIFVDTSIKKEVIERLNHLKYIALMSTGYNHVDMNECKKKGIIVSNVPNYGEYTVAEYTFSLILSLSRNLRKTYHLNYMNTELISLSETNKFTGFDLYGKTLGVIGTGRIGAHVIKIAKGFSMNVIAFDKFPNTKLKESLGFEYVTLDELLKRSDIITIHVPLFKDTYHLINKENISLIKKGAIIINTSRGEVIDTESLLNSIKKGQIYKAGLDVIEYENLLKEDLNNVKNLSFDETKGLLIDYKLIHTPNVIYTPHIAFNTKEAIIRILDTTIENIESYINGNIKNQVNIY